MDTARTRLVAALACIAVAATPAPALAKKKRQHAHGAKTPAVTIYLDRKYDAGGNGAGALVLAPGQRVHLFDPLAVAVALGDQALAQVGLPPVATLTASGGIVPAP